jgi:hypothetical protein
LSTVEGFCHQWLVYLFEVGSTQTLQCPKAFGSVGILIEQQEKCQMIYEKIFIFISNAYVAVAKSDPKKYETKCPCYWK